MEGGRWLPESRSDDGWEQFSTHRSSEQFSTTAGLDRKPAPMRTVLCDRSVRTDSQNLESSPPIRKHPLMPSSPHQSHQIQIPKWFVLNCYHSLQRKREPQWKWVNTTWNHGSQEYVRKSAYSFYVACQNARMPAIMPARPAMACKLQRGNNLTILVSKPKWEDVKWFDSNVICLHGKGRIGSGIYKCEGWAGQGQRAIQMWPGDGWQPIELCQRIRE